MAQVRGYLVIDHTEAMTVIDVNTGRFVGKRDQEETILRTTGSGTGDCLPGEVGGALAGSSLSISSIWSGKRTATRSITPWWMPCLRTRPDQDFRVSDLGLIEIFVSGCARICCGHSLNPATTATGAGIRNLPCRWPSEIFREVRRLGHESSSNVSSSGRIPLSPCCYRSRNSPG